MIFIDLETRGKEERQPGDTVKSHHSLDDIPLVKSVLKNAQLMVRVNSLWENSKYEIDTAINNGADIIMLPYFKTASEVKRFIEIVDKRAKVMLLCETKDAVENIDEILKIDGIDRIHIGLNDLHLCYGLSFMFELLTNGVVRNLCDKFKTKNIPYGFGGIARIGEGAIPAETVLTEHKRLGSDAVILSRTFCNCEKITDLDEIRTIFESGIKELRRYEKTIETFDDEKFKTNYFELSEKIKEVVKERETV